MAQGKKKECKYGSKCYRKNPQHIKDFNHPSEQQDEEESEESTIPVANGGHKRDRGGNKGKQSISDYFKGDNSSDEPEGKKSKTDDDGTDGSDTEPDVVGEKDREEESDEIERKDEEASQSEEACAASPSDVRENIQSKYRMEMPEDFYSFWEFCKTINSSKPQDAFLSTLNLRLCGPFDILSGRHKRVTHNKKGRRPNYLLHMRFYFDPPEFQTVLVAGGESQFHLGYYRDDPGCAPVFVASNSPTDTKEKITPSGDNLFAAVRLYTLKLASKSSGKEKTSLQNLAQSMSTEAERLGLSLEANSKQMKQRQKKVVCPTFHGAGLVVPVDDNEVGYRPVPETPGDLKKMFRKISESKTESEKEEHEEDLQELVTLVQFANDEADYGEGLELGIDLFSFGGKVFHPYIATLLPLAYQLLNRPVFGSIIEAHLEDRRKEGVDELE